MKRHSLRQQLVMFALLAAAGCAGDSDSSSPTGGDGANESDASAASADGGAFGGSGGASGRGGVSGGGGAFGTGGSSSGGQGTSADGGLPNANPCPLQIGGLSVTSLSRVVAGPEANVTVQARLNAGFTKAPSSFSWAATLGGQQVAEQFVGTPEFTFPVRSAGKYTVALLAILDGVACNITSDVVAVLASERATDLWLRVIPPAASTLVPYERALRLTSAQALAAPVRLEAAKQVMIAPKSTSPLGNLIEPSFVRLTSKTSTFRWESHTMKPNGVVQGYTAQLDPFLTYDVLVVPDGNFAPFMLPGRQDAYTLNANPIRVLPGAMIAGRTVASAGAVAGARILFRSGDVPSTLGISSAAGNFSVLISNGTFGATIRGPDQSELPDLTLAEQNGIVVPAVGSVPDITVQWNTLPTSQVALQVVSPGTNEKVVGAEVQIQTENDLADGGTVTIGTAAPRSLTAKVLRRKTTDANGSVTFANLPRGTYQVQLTPPRTPGFARTWTKIVVDTPDLTMVIKVAASAKITGTLQPQAAAAGALVQAIDSEAPSDPPAVTTVGNDGTYSLSVAPFRNYLLRVIPTAASGYPAALLPTVPASTSMQPWTLASATRIEGTVTTNDGAGLAGSIVQIYCLDQRGDCICPAATATCATGSNASTAVPLVEVLSDDKGHFKLLAVDPTSM